MPREKFTKCSLCGEKILEKVEEQHLKFFCKALKNTESDVTEMANPKDGLTNAESDVTEEMDEQDLDYQDILTSEEEEE